MASMDVLIQAVSRTGSIFTLPSVTVCALEFYLTQMLE